MRREGRSNCRADARQALRNSGTSEPTPGNQISRPSASALKTILFTSSCIISYDDVYVAWNCRPAAGQSAVEPPAPYGDLPESGACPGKSYKSPPE